MRRRLFLRVDMAAAFGVESSQGRRITAALNICDADVTVHKRQM